MGEVAMQLLLRLPRRWRQCTRLATMMAMRCRANSARAAGGCRGAARAHYALVPAHALLGRIAGREGAQLSQPANATRRLRPGEVLSPWGGLFSTAFCSTDCPRSASYEVIAAVPSCTSQQPHPGPQPAYNAAASSYESCWPRGMGQRGCARPAPRGQAPGVLPHSKRQPASTGGSSSSPAGL